MYKKHFTVYFVFFVTVAISLHLVRGQDCDPTTGCSEQSYCVASGYCSCLSGFSGDSCAVPPSSSCSSSYKDPNGSESSLDSQLEFSLTLNTLNVQLNATLEKNRYVDSSATPLQDNSHDSTYSLGTTISWSGSSNCDYPSSIYWTKAPVADGSCLDSYSFRMDVNDAISSCGFTYDRELNVWKSELTVTRYYSLPPDMSIVDPSRRVEGRPMISVESKTTVITLPSSDPPKTQAPAPEADKDAPSASSETEEKTPSLVTTSGPSYDRALLIKIAAALAGAIGLAFIAAIIVIIAVRRRRSRKAQAQFNFEGINSN